MFFLFVLIICLNSFSIEFFPLEDLKEGMVGEVKTVLKGTELKTYPIEIKGIIRGTTQKDFIIIGKLREEEFDKTGIIAGMSGSPVYLEGKLLGALAYAWLFSKEPLCGITYIKNLVSLNFQKKESINFLSYEDLIQGDLKIRERIEEDFIKLIKKSQENLTFHSYPYKENSFYIIEGGVVKKDINYPIEGGMPISALLSWGDFDLFASGTITLRDKDTLYAFGHPFLDLGDVEIPFARAYPEVVVSSLLRSFRLSNRGEILGSIYIDGKDGIVGKIGKKPQGIKVEVSLLDKRKTFFVVDNPLLLPIISGMGVSSILYDEKMDSGSAIGRFEIKVFGERDVREEFFIEGEDLLSSIQSKIVSFIGILSLNPFKSFKINSIDVNLKDLKEKNKEKILKVWLSKGKIKDKEEFEINILLEDYKGKRNILRERVRFPFTSKSGGELIIGGFKNLEGLMKKEQFPFQNMEDLIEWIREKPKEGALNILIKVPINSLLKAPFSFNTTTPFFYSRFPENKKKSYGIYKIKHIFTSAPVEGYYEYKFGGER